jgi:Transposase
VDGAYLDWALADFSGYVAIDELYDGPFCVLSIVDNRTFKRLIYQVLDHDPNHKDILAFLRRFQTHLQQRGLTLRGVTTDASPLYPEPLRVVFGAVPHQICEFHVIKELNKAILRAVAKVRKGLAARKPTLKRGRPSGSAAKKAARQRERLQRKIADLFDQRFRFVQHTLTAAERRTLQHITRGLPQLRTLREIMDEVYRLFDRRCRTDTALAKLAKLRQRVRRFKAVGKVLSKLQSPNLDKALTFLDDKLLPSTSNAVERGNRRHRKMQKSLPHSNPEEYPQPDRHGHVPRLTKGGPHRYGQYPPRSAGRVEFHVMMLKTQ